MTFPSILLAPADLMVLGGAPTPQDAVTAARDAGFVKVNESWRIRRDAIPDFLARCKRARSLHSGMRQTRAQV